MIVFLYALLGNLLIQIANFFATKTKMEGWMDVITYNFKILPLIITFNVFFTAYFVFALKNTSLGLGYGVLNIISFSISVLLGLGIQYFLFKAPLTIPQIVGVVLIIAGIAVINIWK